MFTQGQACQNRQLLPCQDTPAIRATYTATVRCGKAYTVVMAAKMLNKMEKGTVSDVCLACVCGGWGVQQVTTPTY